MGPWNCSMALSKGFNLAKVKETMYLKVEKHWNRNECHHFVNLSIIRTGLVTFVCLKKYCVPRKPN